MATTVLDAASVSQALERMADSIYHHKQDGPWAVVGIRRGGDHLAERLANLLARRNGVKPPVGVVDITLYRDDGFDPHQWPQVGVTHIPFPLAQFTVVLVDDVLYTGRTVRAALDVILDYGRPRAVRLAVLVDRGLHELPIRADAVGVTVDAADHDHVDVQLVEAGHKTDAVLLERANKSEQA